MKFLTLLSALLVIALQADAFAPSHGACNRHATTAIASSNNEDADAAILSRRAAMMQGAATSSAMVTTLLVASPQIASADIYDEQEKARKLKAREDAENARKLVPAILLGGTALSVPFFFPNLVRLAKKFASGGEDDGYGN
mmetsp:Transcript_3733/g.9775  ORF Transcript_3733/g.9775 Transcript_3733/m.9775 type:complete len:141 (+) Transcript_3733:98-520(+)|eukprot:CAMPEP_0197176786 /NCGR_PEP_ID=MMETSP1423-20130617/2594_1 /TAXON_ID=476441 /ORGANISM="Pseudo-nitzschia heimii, Strain UNC1101" /LENGTH=140 /DNA_ID=CAMNT_0042626207 /DNA_START=94 /DNA_END=516 /DNA_ORIENTATION=-